VKGVVLRTYRAEYVFGFVLGMTFVFGSTLPTMAALVAGTVAMQERPTQSAPALSAPGYQSPLAIAPLSDTD
jgi:hypothetical protein